MILIVKKINEQYHRLCNDNKFRLFAPWGDASYCGKEYKVLGHAKNKAKRIKAEVAIIPDGMEVDAITRVMERITDGNFEKIVNHQLKDFINAN